MLNFLRVFKLFNSCVTRPRRKYFHTIPDGTSSSITKLNEEKNSGCKHSKNEGKYPKAQQTVEYHRMHKNYTRFLNIYVLNDAIWQNYQ